MQKLFRDLGLILALAALWGLSGYALGIALGYFGFSYPPLKTIIASSNIVIGMLMLKGIISTPRGDRLFFNGPTGDEDGDPRIGCLWGLPLTFLFLAILLTAWSIIFRLIHK